MRGTFLATCRTFYSVCITEVPERLISRSCCLLKINFINISLRTLHIRKINFIVYARYVKNLICLKYRYLEHFYYRSERMATIHLIELKMVSIALCSLLLSVTNLPSLTAVADIIATVNRIAMKYFHRKNCLFVDRFYCCGLIGIAFVFSVIQSAYSIIVVNVVFIWNWKTFELV